MRNKTLTSYPFVLGGALVLALSYSLMLFDMPTLRAFTMEDSWVENLTAILFFLGGVVCIFSFLKDSRGNDFFVIKTRKNYFFLLTGLFLFVCGGEEISWGQRIFGWPTPSFLKDANLQRETNIHNLIFFHGQGLDGRLKTGWAMMFTGGRIFSIIWLLYAFCIPILNRIFKALSSGFRRINLPIVPLPLGIFFMVTYVVAKTIEIATKSAHHYVHQAAGEIKEFNFAFLWVLVSGYFLAKIALRKDTKAKRDGSYQK